MLFLQIKKVFAVLLTFCAALQVLPLAAEEAAPQEMPVDESTVPSPIFISHEKNSETIYATVGFPKMEGMYFSDSNGRKYSYFHELMDTIAQKGNIKFSYIESDSREDLYSMVKRGIADVICPVNKGVGIEGTTPLPRSIGPLVQMICARNYDYRFFADDYQNFDGMSIALIDSIGARDTMEAFEQAYGFKTIKHYYNKPQEVKDALERGDTDLALINNYMNSSNLLVLSKISTSDFYMSVSDARPELKDAIHKAFEAVILENPFFLFKLSEKYLSTYTAKKFALTRAEADFIKTSPVINVYMRNDIPLISMEKDGEFIGYIPTLLKEITKKTGLKFKLIGCEDAYAIVESVKAEPDTSFAGCLMSSKHLLQDTEFKFITAMENYPLAIVTKKNRSGKNIRFVAYPKDSYARKEAVAENGFQGVEYEDDLKCLEAVADGKVDAAMINNYNAKTLLNRRKFSSLLDISTEPSISSDILLGVSSDSSVPLFGILEKLCMDSKKDDITIFMHEREILGYINPTLVEMLLDNWYIMVLGMLVFGAAIIIIIMQRKFNIELEASNRNKDVFLANMSHDFRTPLTAINGFAYIGQNENDPKYYPQIITSASYMQELVNDILNIQQYSEGKALELQPEALSAETLYDNILSVMHGKAVAKRIKIDFKSDISYPYILADPMRIKQIFVNLIGNAIKYSPEDSSVKVTVTDHVKSKRIWVKATVSDNGEGMSRDFINHRIFLPFEREKNAFSSKEGGSGLGLAITKIIIDRLGGNISVASELGKGSTFTVDYPEDVITKDEYEKTRRDNGMLTGKEFDFSGFRVLLCEDNEINTFIVSNLLQKKGCLVDCAENGKIGLEKYSASPAGYYRLILMDIRMPEMDGIETATAIRALNRGDAQRVPIIALSANAFEEDKLKSAEAGMNAHLSKPIDVAVLYRTLEHFRNAM